MKIERDADGRVRPEQLALMNPGSAVVGLAIALLVSLFAFGIRDIATSAERECAAACEAVGHAESMRFEHACYCRGDEGMTSVHVLLGECEVEP